MDLLHFLDRRLAFDQKLYDSTVGPFEEQKRQIDAGEPPYDYAGDPEDYDGDPPFLEEWQEADDSAMGGRPSFLISLTTAGLAPPGIDEIDLAFIIMYIADVSDHYCGH